VDVTELPVPATPVRLALVAVGETTWDVAAIVTGQRNVPQLTARGHDQAAAAAAVVAWLSPVRLLTGDGPSCLATAGELGRATGLRPFPSGLLRDRGLGELEGRPLAEVAAAIAELDLEADRRPPGASRARTCGPGRRRCRPRRWC
jgi:broad specificity phosphatase PhoE